MGRPRKPAAARAREGGTARAGSVSHRPIPSTELAVVAGRAVPIEPPDELPPPARELWIEVVHALAAAGIIDKVDLPALRLACLQYGRVRAAGDVLDDPVDKGDLEELDQQIKDMAAIAGALKGEIANRVRAGIDVPPAKVNAARDYEGQLVNLRAYRRALGRVGNLVALGSTGQLVAHPLLSVERESTGAVLRIMGKLGLTPADRAALGLQILEGRTMQRELDEAIGASAKRTSAKRK